MPLFPKLFGRSKASAAPGMKPGKELTSAQTPANRVLSQAVNLPGFPAVPSGTFKTYRSISAYPTVALVRMLVTGPIRRNSWSWMRRPDTDDAMFDLAKDCFDKQRAAIVRDGLEALSMGFAPFEEVWGRMGGRSVVTRLKPLEHERTQIDVDDRGNFDGLTNRGVQDERPVELDKLHAFCYTYNENGRAGDPYGRSRHENIRETWSHARSVNERLGQYLRKIAGVTVQLHYPDGDSLDAAGAKRPNFWLAQQILRDVEAGKSIAFVNKFASFLGGDGGNITPASMEKALAAAGKSDWVLSAFDPGSADLSGGMLAALAYYDKLIFRGWLRPERSGLEADRGGIGTSDSSEHADIGLTDSELLDWDFCDAFSKGVIDDVLVQNYGEGARGAVWVEPAPLTDDSREVVVKLLEIVMSNPALSASLFSVIDWKAAVEDSGVPLIEPVAEAMAKIAEQSPEQTAKQLLDRVLNPPQTGKGGDNPEAPDEKQGQKEKQKSREKVAAKPTTEDQ